MSYDIVFWRQSASDVRSLRRSFDALSKRSHGEGNPGTTDRRVSRQAPRDSPEAVRELDGDHEWIHWVSPDESSGAEIEWTTQYVWITRRPLDHDRAIAMIDIADEFGCALYDPLINERRGS